MNTVNRWMKAVVLAIAWITLLAGGEARAANTWDGGGADDNWGTAANWDNDAVPSFPRPLTFAGMVRLTPNNEAADRTVSNLIFAADAGPFTIAGSTFTLAGNITNNSTAVQTVNNTITLGATRTVTANANGADIVLGGAIGDSSSGYGLTKAGAGTLTLNGNNTFSGTVTLDGAGGRLIMGHANALGLGAGAIALTAGTLDPGDAARTIANPVTLTAHTIAGTNNLTINGTLTASGANRTLTSSLDTGKTLTLTNVVIDHTAASRLELYGSGDTTINGVISESGSQAKILTLINRGTTTISGTNAYTGETRVYGGGTVILDYGAPSSAQDGSKLADLAVLRLAHTSSAGVQGGSDLVLKGGTHTEVVLSTYMSGSGHFNVIRQGVGATSKLQLGLITFNTVDSLNFSQDDLATCDNANTNGILKRTDGNGPAIATVGGVDWAYNSTGGAGGLIKALPASGYADYKLVSNVASNLLLTGSYTNTTAAKACNTIKIVSDGNDQLLDTGANTHIQATFGGILYAGGGNNKYTIRGTGAFLGGANTRSIVVASGAELTLDVPIGNSVGCNILKYGPGRAVFATNNTTTGAIRITEGAVRLKHSGAAGTTANGITVAVSPAGSALELDKDRDGNPISIGSETNSLNGNGISNGGALRNISGNNTYGGPITIELQGARINSDQDTLTLSGGVITASGNDVTFGGAGNITVSTVAISGAGGVTKDGAGTLELLAANTYTGPTTVTGGTLKVSGSLGATAVRVSAGGTLTGGGSCSNVFLAAGGRLVTTNTTLTVSNLVLSANCTNYFDGGRTGVVVTAAGTVNDTLGLTIHPGAKVVLTGVSANSTNNLIQYSGTIKRSWNTLTVVEPKPFANASYNFITNAGYVAVVVGPANSAPTIDQGAGPLAASAMDEDGSPTAWAAPTLSATDTDGDTLTWGVKTQAAHGTATVNGTGASPSTFTYAPAADYHGSDSFVVKVTDPSMEEASIAVNVTINARNDAPVCTVDPVVSGTHVRGQTLSTTDGTWNDDIDTQYGGSFTPGYTYQWQRADDAGGTGADNIGSATANTYTLAVADIAKYVRVRVTCTDSGVGGGGNQSTQAYSTPWTLVAAPVLTWTGGDGTDNHWERTANWSPALTPSTGDEIVFSGTPARLDPYLETGYSISKLTFASGTVSLAPGAAPGATLTFTGNTVSNASVNPQTNSMPMALSSAVTFSAAAGGLVQGGALSGSGSLVKTGINPLTLSGDNSALAGGVTLAAGRLNINHANALGSGTFTVNAGALDNTTAAGITITNAMAMNGNFTYWGTTNLTQTTGVITLDATPVVTVTNTFTLNGAISGGVNGLTKAGNGTLVLGHTANTFDGTLTIQRGTLSVASLADGGAGCNGTGDIMLGAAGANSTPVLTYTGTGATLATRGMQWVAGVTGGGVTINNNGTGPLNFSKSPFNAGGAGTMTMTLGGSNGGTFSGAITNGTATSLGVTVSGGAWTLSGDNRGMSGGVTITTGGSLTLSSAYCGGSGTLTMSFVSTQYVGHASALAGITNLVLGNAGPVIVNAVGSAVTLPLNPPILLQYNSSAPSPTFDCTGGDMDLGSGAVTVKNNPTLTVTGGKLTLGGVVTCTDTAGNRTLTKAGNGTLVLLADSSTAWGTLMPAPTNFAITVNAGTLEFANGALGNMDDATTGKIKLNTGGTLKWVAGNTQDVSRKLAIDSSQSVTLDLQANNVTFAYALNNPQSANQTSVSITKLGSGTLTLANLAALHAGGTFSISGGTVVAAARNNMMTSGTLAFDGGTLKYDAGFDASTGGMTINAGGATLDVQGYNATNASTIAGTGSLTKKGSGALTLSATNSYTGGTTLDAGQLNINTNRALGAGAGALLTIKGGTTLDNTGAYNVTLANNPVQSWEGDFTYAGALGRALNLGSGTVTMTGSRQVTVSAGSLSVGGIAGAGYALQKLGNGTLGITGNSTYSGNTTISGGSLTLSGSGAISSSPVITVGSGASFDVSTYTLASGQTMLGEGTVTGDLTAGSGSTNSPGASGASGTMAHTNGTLTWAGGGTYRWELSQVDTGVVSQDAHKGTWFDWYDGSSGAALACTATSGNKFTIRITRLGGSVANWDNAKEYTWIIATAAGGISGISSANITLDTSAFGENLGDGAFSVLADGNDLKLLFKATANALPVISPPGVLTATMSEDGNPTAWPLTTNDVSATDANGDTLSWSVGVAASHGIATVEGTGANPTNFAYVPDADYNGTDSFWVKVADGNGGDDMIEVIVTNTPVNDAPVCSGVPISGAVMAHSNVWLTSAGTNRWNDAVDTNNSAGSLSFAYMWQITSDTNGTPTVTDLGVTATNYTLTGGDRGKWIRLREICTDGGIPLPGISVTNYSGWCRETSTVTVVVFTNALGNQAWGSYANWAPDAVPTTNITAVVGDTNVKSPATVEIGAGDTAAAKNLHVATNDNSIGTVTMTGGTLAFPAAGSISVAPGSNSVGTLNQTGGTILGITAAAGNLTVASGTNSTGTLIMGGSSAVTSIFSVASAPGSSGTLTLTNSAYWKHSASTVRTVGSAAGAIGRLNVLGSAGMDFYGAGVRGLALATAAGSTGELTVAGTAWISNAVVTVASPGAKGRVFVRDDGVLEHGGPTGTRINIDGDNSEVTVSDNGTLFGHLTIGVGTGSSGTVVLTNYAKARVAPADTTYVGYSNNAVGYLYVRGNALMNRGVNDGGANSRPMVLGDAPGSTGIVEIAEYGVITNVSTFTVGNLGYGRLTIRGNGALYQFTSNPDLIICGGTNNSSMVTVADNGVLNARLKVGNAAGSDATLIFTNNARYNQTYPFASIVGNAAGAVGRVKVSDAAVLDYFYNNAQALTLGAVAGSTGIVEMTGGMITNVSTLDVGSLGYGRLTIAGPGTSVVDSATITVGATNGAYGRVEISGGTWIPSGTLNAGVSGGYGQVEATGGDWRQSGALGIGTTAGSTGRVSVANCTQTNIAGAVTVGGGATAGDRYGSITVSNAAFGGGTRVMVLTNGFVTLTGTGSVFICNTFTNNGGCVTNTVRVMSGGVDVTNSANTALVITNGGTMNLVFDEGADSLGEFWGLRWNGNGHKGQLEHMASLGQLSWDDTAVGGSVEVFTNATHTMVGYVTKYIGTTFRFR